MPSLADDLAEDLLREDLAKPAKRRETVQRQLEWSNAQSFTDGGYIAKAARQVCKCCGGVQTHILGIFHCELAPNGTRRLQALTRGAQWPLIEGHVIEFDDSEVPYCVACLSAVGFTKEQATPATYTRVVGQPFGVELGPNLTPMVRL